MADHEDPERYYKQHNLYDAVSEPTSVIYVRMVDQLVDFDDSGWEDLPIYEDDIRR